MNRWEESQGPSSELTNGGREAAPEPRSHKVTEPPSYEARVMEPPSHGPTKPWSHSHGATELGSVLERRACRRALGQS